MRVQAHDNRRIAEEPKYLYDGISSAGIRRAAALLWPDWVEVEGCEVEQGWDEPEDLLDERLMDVARRIEAAWRASLAAAYPGRSFAVYVATPDEDHGPTVYALSEPSVR